MFAYVTFASDLALKGISLRLVGAPLATLVLYIFY